MYYTQRVHIIFISKRGSLPSLKILINMFISPFGCQCIKNNQFNDILISSWYLSMFPHILKQCLSFRVDISNRVLQMGILTLRNVFYLEASSFESVLSKKLTLVGFLESVRGFIHFSFIAFGLDSKWSRVVSVTDLAIMQNQLPIW